MRGWFRKTEKVTAATARRITGISTPFGGLQWADPGPTEHEAVRGYLVFLEDRRVLYNPYDLEVPSQVHHSLHEIRHECTDVLRRLGAKSFAAVPIRAIREACRRFHDDENIDFRFFDRPDHRGIGVGFFVALGALRATVGQRSHSWPATTTSTSKVILLRCYRIAIPTERDSAGRPIGRNGGSLPMEGVALQWRSPRIWRILLVNDGENEGAAVP